MSDLCRRNYIGLCRGDVCVCDLGHRNYIGICKGILIFAKEVFL